MKKTGKKKEKRIPVYFFIYWEFKDFYRITFSVWNARETRNYSIIFEKIF